MARVGGANDSASKARFDERQAVLELLGALDMGQGRKKGS